VDFQNYLHVPKLAFGTNTPSVGVNWNYTPP
jgi:hypothetical protein